MLNSVPSLRIEERQVNTIGQRKVIIIIIKKENKNEKFKKENRRSIT